MLAGYAQSCVNPSLPTFMEGLGQPVPATVIHDDLYLRATYLTHDGQPLLIVGCDLLFFERPTVDRFKGAIGRVLQIAPHQILFNVSHNHAGPRLTRWAYSGQADPYYLDQVERALLDCAKRAKASAVEVEVWAGVTKTDVPVSRRNPDEHGKAKWKPYLAAPVCDALPVTVLKTPAGKIVSILFCVSCHPSSFHKYEISADYPGIAQRLINAHFKSDCALFLQGAGGDTKPRQVAVGETHWRSGDGNDIQATGKTVAEAVIKVVESGLKRYKPEIRCHYEETFWPMKAAPTADELKAKLADPASNKTIQNWAKDMLERLERVGPLPTEVPVGLHAVQIARGVRFIALEGESVAELGLLTLKHYDAGITFPLGYTNGTQLYLPVSRMHSENGYEVDSFYEYHWPAELEPVEEKVVAEALSKIQSSGAVPNDAVLV